MPTRLNPYLSFRDDAREAMEFYRSVFGGELNVSTFADFHASDDPSEADKVMHSQLEAPNGIELMAQLRHLVVDDPAGAVLAAQRAVLCDRVPRLERQRAGEGELLG